MSLRFGEFIHSPHLLVQATSERFLPAGGTFRVILANESHWLQPMLVLFIHWWPAPTGVGSVLDYHTLAKKSSRTRQKAARQIQMIIMALKDARPTNKYTLLYTHPLYKCL